MLGVGSYLTGFAFRRLTACATATMIFAFCLALDSRVATLLLSTLLFSVTLSASHTAAESCVI